MNIIELARESGFKVDWQHADVAEIKAQRYVAFANAVIKAHTEELIDGVGEPVAWVVYDIKHGGGATLHWPNQHSEYGDADQFKAVPLYTNPAPVQQEPYCGKALQTAVLKIMSLEAHNKQLLEAMKLIAQLGRNLQTTLQVGMPDYSYADWLDMAQDIEDEARAAIAQVEGK